MQSADIHKSGTMPAAMGRNETLKIEDVFGRGGPNAHRQEGQSSNSRAVEHQQLQLVESTNA